MNGGYVMIDRTGIELTTETAQTVPGIYAAMKKAVACNKPIYAVNCTWESDIMTPVAVMVTPRSSGDFIATASTLQLDVTENDTVTVINMLT